VVPAAEGDSGFSGNKMETVECGLEGCRREGLFFTETAETIFTTGYYSLINDEKVDLGLCDEEYPTIQKQKDLASKKTG
jgi:hypothetical protein